MDCSLPGSFVHGIFQARVLEWVAIAFSECERELVGFKRQGSLRFSSTYTKIGLIQRRLAWPPCKDDTQIHEAFLTGKKKNSHPLPLKMTLDLAGVSPMKGISPFASTTKPSGAAIQHNYFSYRTFLPLPDFINPRTCCKM